MFGLPNLTTLRSQKSVKITRLSIQNSFYLWFSLLEVRSAFWFLDLFAFRSLKIAPLGARRTLPGFLGALPERAGDAPSRPRALLGRPGTPQEGPRTDFWSILGAPRNEIASKFRLKFDHISTEI